MCTNRSRLWKTQLKCFRNQKQTDQTCQCVQGLKETWRCIKYIYVFFPASSPYWYDITAAKGGSTSFCIMECTFSLVSACWLTFGLICKDKVKICYEGQIKMWYLSWNYMYQLSDLNEGKLCPTIENHVIIKSLLKNIFPYFSQNGWHHSPSNP